MKILLVEDDVRLVSIVREALTHRGHVIDTACDGPSGLSMAKEGGYDAVVLDVMLPGINGFSVARELRASGIATPILMLTAKDTARDVVEGINSGADDYLRKPFVFDELDARLLAITRREGGGATQVRELHSGDIVMDLITRRVYRGEREIPLTARETAFLEFFLRHPGALLTRRQLEDSLWELDRESGSNVIEVYVGRLRRKLSPDGESRAIETVRGGGYRLIAENRG
jgi:two-component system, OmpR family, response regulator